MHGVKRCEGSLLRTLARTLGAGGRRRGYVPNCIESARLTLNASTGEAEAK
jgi:hypothetical protein